MKETSAMLDPKQIRAAAKGARISSAAAPRRAMPAQKPSTSKQDYGTPPEFIEAVLRRFKIKAFYYDLAADAENSKGRFHYCKEEDTLKQDWTKHGDKHLWLNPEFGDIARYAQKCAAFVASGGARRGGRIYFLTPASVGANWFAAHVWGIARVIALKGRLSFDGVAPYPKDCMLSVFGLSPGFEVWDWKNERGRSE